MVGYLQSAGFRIPRSGEAARDSTNGWEVGFSSDSGSTPRGTLGAIIVQTGLAVKNLELVLAKDTILLPDSFTGWAHSLLCDLEAVPHLTA